jgi:hypothetical protein
LKIDDKTFNTPVTVLGAWADYFEDLPTPSEQQSFDSTFLMLVNDHFSYCLCYLLAFISSGKIFPFS